MPLALLVAVCTIALHEWSASHSSRFKHAALFLLGFGLLAGALGEYLAHRARIQLLQVLCVALILGTVVAWIESLMFRGIGSSSRVWAVCGGLVSGGLLLALSSYAIGTDTSTGWSTILISGTATLGFFLGIAVAGVGTILLAHVILKERLRK